jgi:calcineurin-like phosphoesterase family protein
MGTAERATSTSRSKPCNPTDAGARRGARPSESKEAGVRRRFVIADTHWGHGNIIRFCGRPANHDHVMLERWARTVGPDDLVYHLGDLVWNRAGHLWPAIKALPGEKWLVPGNHDTFTNARFLRDMGFKVVPEAVGREWRWDADHVLVEALGFRVALSHAPLRGAPADVNVHGHVHNHSTWDRRTHVNACVEVNGYAPQDLDQLVFDWDLRRRLAAQ